MRSTIAVLAATMAVVGGCANETEYDWDSTVSFRQKDWGPEDDGGTAPMIREAKLCMPCNNHEDCLVAAISAVFACRPAADGQGSFCTIGCSPEQPCPDGYECLIAGGGTECFPVGQQCECSALAISMGASTNCEAPDGPSACPAKMACTPEGLSPCTAAQPEAEICNGLDDDCDGLVDEDFLDLYGNGIADCFETIKPDPDTAADIVEDTGSDAAGDAVGETVGDIVPDWADGDDDGDGTKNGDDCAPLIAAIHPGAAEICNGKDDDCDGIKDPEGAEGCIPLYKDADDDGYGAEPPKCLCGSSDGYSLEKGGDCDDGNGAIHPGAKEECNDKDDDCDGKIDPPGICQTAHKVCIDPGDGGSDPGAVGIITEKNVNLAMGKQAKSWLDKDSASGSGGGTWTVLMTRESDVTVSLASRVEYANSNGAERFISIHNNSCGSCGGKGTESYTKNGAAGTATDLAGKVQNKLVSLLGLKDRGVKKGDYYTLTNTNMPAVLTLPGFIDTQTDVNVINSAAGQKNAGKAIMHALQSHFGYGEFTP